MPHDSTCACPTKHRGRGPLLPMPKNPRLTKRRASPLRIWSAVWAWVGFRVSPESVYSGRFIGRCTSDKRTHLNGVPPHDNRDDHRAALRYAAFCYRFIPPAAGAEYFATLLREPESSPRSDWVLSRRLKFRGFWASEDFAKI